MTTLLTVLAFLWATPLVVLAPLVIRFIREERDS